MHLGGLSMEKTGAARHSETFDNISLTRMVGFAFERVWVFIIFYSIMFYTGSDDVNRILELLYLNLSLSMAVMGASFLIAGVILGLLRKVGFRPSRCKPFMFGAAGLMTIGALMLIISDLDSINGTMVLMVSAFLTGVGSACLMHCFFESFAGAGSRTTVLEMSVGAGIALLASFALVMLPPIYADIVIVIAPPLSALFLCRSAESSPSVPQEHPAPKAPFSPRTKLFFGKALAGALVIGFIEGFYDGFFGYSPLAATLSYNGTLFIAGFIAVIALAIISTAAPRDMLFHIYRISLALFALACLLSVAMGDFGLYSSSLFFSGYTCFVLLLTAVCVETSESYEINPSLLFGVAFFVLYLGELLGANCNAVLLPANMGEGAPATCCILCLFLLFVSSTYLFTEMDLVTIGIGEVRCAIADSSDKLAENERREDEAGKMHGLASGPKSAGASTDRSSEMAREHPQGTMDPAEQELISIQEAAERIARDYHLSARESEVLPLLLAGRTINRIQDALYISAGTVSTHIRHIYQKTGVNRKQQLIDLGERYIQGTQPDPADQAGGR